MENKFAWIMTPNKPWDDKKEMITTALESGISYVLDLDDYDKIQKLGNVKICLLYTSPSPRDTR